METKTRILLADSNSDFSTVLSELIAAENDRVEEAKRIAAAKIDDLQKQIQSCVQALERIKQANKPAPTGAFDYDQDEGREEPSTDAVANEISASLQALVGTTEDTAPKAEPNHPVSDTTGKFANLKFGRNYDPSHS